MDTKQKRTIEDKNRNAEIRLVKISDENRRHHLNQNQSYPETSESDKLKSLIKQTLGLDSTAATLRPILSEQQQMRLSSVTLEMLMEREEIDIHPYGRGGIYEGILYRNRAEEQIDMISAFIWFIFVSSVIMMAGSIVFVSGKLNV
ncbi:unnamed protein product [Heterobilharzia americana]|nr:unnamed protein product [Heterobilharzia americana]